MREFCLTEEGLQQFVDGELSPEQTEMTATHVAACRPCALLLSEVEQENALLAEAFAPEMSLSVPTIRLRERLDAAVAALEPRPRQIMDDSTGSRLRALFGSLLGSFSFTPQRAFGFASLAVVVSFAAIFAVIQLRHSKDATPTVAVNTGAPRAVQSPAKIEVEKGAENGSFTPSDGGPAPVNNVQLPKNVKATYKAPNARQKPVNESASKPTDGQGQKVTTTPQLLPGEKSYLEAIASLTTAIETNNNEVFKPTVRADYERNLAVVDQAIATTRQQAKRNPGDRDAAEFMYTAYQNKIELLSAVADQTRIASR